MEPDHSTFRDVIRCGKKRPTDCIDNKVSYKNENYYTEQDSEYMETYKCTQPNGEPRPEPEADPTIVCEMHNEVEYCYNVDYVPSPDEEYFGWFLAVVAIIFLLIPCIANFVTGTKKETKDV